MATTICAAGKHISPNAIRCRGGLPACRGCNLAPKLSPRAEETRIAMRMVQRHADRILRGESTGPVEARADLLAVMAEMEAR